MPRPATWATLNSDGFDDEEEFEDALEQTFLDNGWRVSRQVTTEDGSGRADMIVASDRYGIIGIELKQAAGMGVLAEAHHQIVGHYREARFEGFGRIKKWAIAPHFKYENCDFGDHRVEFRKHAARNILTPFGVAYLYRKPNVEFCFQYTDNEYKIPVGGRTRETDMDAINDYVQRSMQQYPYSFESKPRCQYDAQGVGCKAPATETVRVANHEVRTCQYHADDLHAAVMKGAPGAD